MEVPRFDQPACYRITVAGHLEAGWAEHLRDLTIDNHPGTVVRCATVTGHLPDQAALLGILNALYDGRITVLAVERLTQDWERIGPAPERPDWGQSSSGVLVQPADYRQEESR